MAVSLTRICRSMSTKNDPLAHFKDPPIWSVRSMYPPSSQSADTEAVKDIPLSQIQALSSLCQVSQGEISSLQKSVSRILGCFKRMHEVNVDGIVPLVNVSDSIPHKLRYDMLSRDSSVTTQSILGFSYLPDSALELLVESVVTENNSMLNGSTAVGERSGANSGSLPRYQVLRNASCSADSFFVAPGRRLDDVPTQ